MHNAKQQKCWWYRLLRPEPVRYVFKSASEFTLGALKKCCNNLLIESPKSIRNFNEGVLCQTFINAEMDPLQREIIKSTTCLVYCRNHLPSPSAISERIIGHRRQSDRIGFPNLTSIWISCRWSWGSLGWTLFFLLFFLIIVPFVIAVSVIVRVIAATTAIRVAPSPREPRRGHRLRPAIGVTTSTGATVTTRATRTTRRAGRRPSKGGM